MATKNKEEILEREISKKDKNGKIVETKKLREIINDSDFWEKDGQFFIREKGVYKIRDFTEAYWRKPTKEDIHQIDRGYGSIVTCVFPDGEESWEPHEATDKNTYGLSNTIKFMMAIKRARATSLLRSRNVGLHDVYSDGDKDLFELEEKRKNEEANPPKKNTQTKSVSWNEIFLSENDPKYPKMKIIEVWKKHQDIEYLNQLKTDKEQTPLIRNAAKKLIKSIENQESKKTDASAANA